MDKKNKVVNVKMTMEQWQKLTTVANSHGLGLSTWMLVQSLAVVARGSATNA